MNRPAFPPPVTNEDKIPHHQAVWRDYQGFGAPANMTGQLPVSLDYGDGQIVQGRADELIWGGVKRWRFGWAPQPQIGGTN